MSWVKIDDRFFDNPKIVALSGPGRLAYLEALTYCARELTDGFVPTNKAKAIAGRVLKELVPHLWEPCESGYMVHDYLIYNPPREQVLAEREAARRRMFNVRAGRVSPDVRPNKARTSGVGSPSPVPVPVPQKTDEVGEIGRAFAQFGKVTAGTVQAIEESIEDYSLDWTRKAVRAASGAGFEGQPPWSYIERTLERWKKQGKPDDEMEVTDARPQKTLVSVGGPRRNSGRGVAVSDGNDVDRFLAGLD